MSHLFLTADELEELTGFKSARGQARWLDQHRWRYALTCSKKPRVSRDYFSERVGARPAGGAPAAGAGAGAEQPNFAALDRR
ncbi:MAG: DUF4224 domain-containing protein [Rhizobacter sp.]|nr:DUF4224 domain-containing protein [Rhizobacter sp.]